MIKNTIIPRELYEKILENIPVFCVDFILNNKNKVLLVHRVNEPAKGQWWIPGGRLFKNETFKNGVLRKACEELGIEVNIERRVGVYEIMFKESPFENVKSGIHDIAICYLVTPNENNFKITLDKTSGDYKWIDKIDKDLHPYVKTILKDSRVFD